MKSAIPKSFNKILSDNSAVASSFGELCAIFERKFGLDSEMFTRATDLFIYNVLQGGPNYGMPKQYASYWEPYKTDKILHHITIKKNVEAIKQYGLEPRDPAPRPWAGMLGIFMGDPEDTLYATSEAAVREHVSLKGEKPVLLRIRTRNNLYKSTELRRTFQVASVDPIKSKEIIEYVELS